MQFEVLGADGIPRYAEELHMGRIGEDWLSRYRKNGGTGHYTANMKSLVVTRDGVPKKPYSRILIRRRRQQTGDVVETCHGASLRTEQPKPYPQSDPALPMAAEPEAEYGVKK